MVSHYVEMMVMMFIAGILSSMSVWADKWSDVRISINDVYMSLLMCAWMLLFMAGWKRDYKIAFMGVVGVIVIFYLIRNQIFVSLQRYIRSMIPHHSMAVLMSKRLLENNRDSSSNIPVEIEKLAKSIIDSQEREINIMKSVE